MAGGFTSGSAVVIPLAKNSVYGYLIAFAAAMGGLLFGYEIGVVSQVLLMDGFKEQFGASYRLANGTFIAIESYKNVLPALTTFTFLIGAFAGAFVVSYMADILGRKKSILIGGVGFLAGSLLQTFASIVGVYFTGRVVSGLGIGVLSMCAPLYISETAPTAIRGRMLTVQQLMITIGILIAASVNSVIIVTLGVTDYRNEWRVAMGMQCVPAVFLLIVMFFMPYSPRWLATQGRDAEALAIIARLRSETVSDVGAVAEYKQIADAVIIERSVGNGSWSELLVPGLRNRLVIAMTIQMFQQLTGINAILYYQGSLLIGMGIDPFDAAIPFTLANDSINFLATFPGMFLVDILGRRKLLLIGGFGMGVAHFLICMFVGVSKISGIPSLSWGAIFSVYLFFFFFASTWGPIPWVYQSEIFPLRVRAKGTGAATMMNWLSNAIVALATPYIADAIDSKMYIIFGALGFIMSIFTFFCVPETMGRSLEDMDKVFGVPGDNNSGFEKGEFKVSADRDAK